jgi:hypothetical protein
MLLSLIQIKNPEDHDQIALQIGDRPEWRLIKGSA